MWGSRVSSCSMSWEADSLAARLACVEAPLERPVEGCIPLALAVPTPFAGNWMDHRN